MIWAVLLVQIAVAGMGYASVLRVCALGDRWLAFKYAKPRHPAALPGIFRKPPVEQDVDDVFDRYADDVPDGWEPVGL